MAMSTSSEILSEITIHGKYARYIPQLQRRELWPEIVTRNAEMHAKKYPQLADEIYDVYAKYVMPKKIFPSMRSLQFAGPAIERSPSRLYNCSYLPVSEVEAFSEIMFLLLGGSGVGISVRKEHIDKLPSVHIPKTRVRRFLVGDSIEG